MYNSNPKPINLQWFAEEEPTPTPEAETNRSPADPNAGNQPEPAGSDGEINKPNGQYTQQDIDKAVQDALAEAAKLAKMNADQKQKYELEKLQKENAKLKAAAAKIEMGKTAAAILKDHKIDATQDILDFVVGTDAEDTKGRIDKFVSIINAQIKAAEIARATGHTPRSYHNSGDAMTEIDRRIAKYQ